MCPSTFDQFFEDYARNVDIADKQEFWKLSDRLIEALIAREIPDTIPSSATIMDAGGGTGRWIGKLAQRYACSFLLYDLSKDMLRQAEENLRTLTTSGRAAIVQGDLMDMRQIESASIDHIVSIYSPLSFVPDPARTVAELHRVLKPGGKLMIMGHGFHNSLASKINNYLAAGDELHRMDASSIVEWAPYVPTLHTFSRARIEDLLRQAGFVPYKTYGVPVFVQPGSEDFDPENLKRSRVSDALGKNPDMFEEVFRLEMKYNGLPEIADRGVNIFSVGLKP